MSAGQPSGPGGKRLSGLDGLRDVVPPPSLVPTVMRRIAEPPPPSFWRWLRKPRRLELRFVASPLGLGAFAAAVGILVLALVDGARTRPTPMVVEVPAPTASASAAATAGVSRAEDGTVLVRFVLVAHGAKKVAVAGDFNSWDSDRTPLQPSGNGSFTTTVKVPPGAHEYMFVVDGQWVTDPAASEFRPDGFGHDNAVLRL